MSVDISIAGEGARRSAEPGIRVSVEGRALAYAYSILVVSASIASTHTEVSDVGGTARWAS